MLLIKNKLVYNTNRGICVVASERVLVGQQVAVFDERFDIVLTAEQIKLMPKHPKDYFFRYCYEYEFGQTDKYILSFDNERYINHSLNPNVDYEGRACKDIEVGEELTANYKELDSATVGRGDKWLD